MDFNVHHYIHFADPRIDDLQTEIGDIKDELHGLGLVVHRVDHHLRVLLNQEISMQQDLTALTAAVQKNTDAEASAIQAIKGLADQVAALQVSDPAVQAQIDALAAEISSGAEALGAAVTASTPAAPPVDTPPVDNPPVDTPPVDTGTGTGDTPPAPDVP